MLSRIHQNLAKRVKFIVKLRLPLCARKKRVSIRCVCLGMMCVPDGWMGPSSVMGTMCVCVCVTSNAAVNTCVCLQRAARRSGFRPGWGLR